MRKPWTDRLFGSRNLWLFAMYTYQHGHPRLAKGIRAANSLLYHNSLPVTAKVRSDVQLAHHGIGTVIHQKVEIGSGVRICQNVTIAVRPSTGAPHGIVIGDRVFIGANSVIITSRSKGIKIGDGARIGAGAVITKDVPAGATMVGNPARIAPQQPEPSRVDQNATPGLSSTAGVFRSVRNT